MSIEVKILELLKESVDLGKGSIQIQNIDLLLGRKGEREFLGAFLIRKLEEMTKSELILNEKSQYAITQKGLGYLKTNSQ